MEQVSNVRNAATRPYSNCSGSSNENETDRCVAREQIMSTSRENSLGFCVICQEDISQRKIDKADPVKDNGGNLDFNVSDPIKRIIEIPAKDVISDNNRVVETRCFHLFHEKCLNGYFRDIVNPDRKCPLCKGGLSQAGAYDATTNEVVHKMTVGDIENALPQIFSPVNFFCKDRKQRVTNVYVGFAFTKLPSISACANTTNIPPIQKFRIATDKSITGFYITTPPSVSWAEIPPCSGCVTVQDSQTDSLLVNHASTPIMEYVKGNWIPPEDFKPYLDAAEANTTAIAYSYAVAIFHAQLFEYAEALNDELFNEVANNIQLKSNNAGRQIIHENYQSYIFEQPPEGCLGVIDNIILNSLIGEKIRVINLPPRKMSIDAQNKQCLQVPIRSNTMFQQKQWNKVITFRVRITSEDGDKTLVDLRQLSFKNQVTDDIFSDALRQDVPAKDMNAEIWKDYLSFLSTAKNTDTFCVRISQDADLNASPESLLVSGSVEDI